jgi:hypothetical protein
VTWTYNLAAIATTPLYQVRLMIGDTVINSQLLQDEEISLFVSLDPSIWRAASRACRAIAGAFTRDADTVQGELKSVLSVRARAYNSLAAQYANDAVSRGGGLPYAGGISVFDKLQQELNPDRVVPQFNLGMDDNLVVPVGPVGNETQDSGNSEPSDP